MGGGCSWFSSRLGGECGIVGVVAMGAGGKGVWRRRFGVGDDGLRGGVVRAGNFAGFAADGSELRRGDGHGWE